MKPDVLLVLYRPDWAKLAATMESLAACISDIRFLRVLISGTATDANITTELLERFGLGAQSIAIHRFDNLGFAGGQNLLLREAFDGGAGFAITFNPDVLVDPGSISCLIEKIRAYPRPDCLFGPVLIATALDGTSDVVDSAGISWGSTARHFDRDQGLPLIDVNYSDYESAQGITGACMVVNQEVYRQLVRVFDHFFDDAFVAYREDADLGIRARTIGIQSVVVNTPGFRHSRGVRQGDRSNNLVNALSVQNRFLIRWGLGQMRPGSWGLPTIRDAAVVAASVFVERGSLIGIVRAWRLRRRARYFGVRRSTKSSIVQ